MSPTSREASRQAQREREQKERAASRQGRSEHRTRVPAGTRTRNDHARESGMGQGKVSEQFPALDPVANGQNAADAERDILRLMESVITEVVALASEPELPAMTPRGCVRQGGPSGETEQGQEGEGRENGEERDKSTEGCRGMQMGGEVASRDLIPDSSKSVGIARVVSWHTDVTYRYEGSPEQEERLSELSGFDRYESGELCAGGRDAGWLAARRSINVEKKSVCVCVSCMHVCVCVCVCVYVCMYVCMYLCTYACMYACMHACMHAYVCVRMYVCL